MSSRAAGKTMKVAALALALVLLSLALQVNIDLNLTDEGYLWYGSIQTVSGHVPVRDFQSYDPGRYCWNAFWMLFFGNGIIALRLSVAIFQGIGLTLGLLTLRRIDRSWLLLTLSGLILLLWMIPRHKLFESSLAMAAVWFAVRLMESPTVKRHFVSGLFIGLAAFFGRNHGLYTFLAFTLTVLFIRFRLHPIKLPQSMAALFGGVLLGYLPMLLMMVVIPGFLESFLEPFRYMLNRGATNTPLPVPWPWLFDYSTKTVFQSLVLVSIGMSFLLLPLYHLSAIGCALVVGKTRRQRSIILAATSFVGIMYMQHAFSRADISHLGQGIAPLIIGLAALPFLVWGDRIKWASSLFLLGLLAMTLFATFPKTYVLNRAMAQPGQYVKVDVAGDGLWLRRGMAAYVETVKNIDARMIGADEGVLFLPWSPTMYPVLGRTSPIRELWFWEPQSDEKQRQFIDRIDTKNVNWIFLEDRALDGNEALRFSNTHPLFWEYIEANFEYLEVAGLTGNRKLFHRM